MGFYGIDISNTDNKTTSYTSSLSSQRSYSPYYTNIFDESNKNLYSQKDEDKDLMTILLEQQSLMMELLFNTMPNNFSLGFPKHAKAHYPKMKLSETCKAGIADMAKDLKMSPKDIEAIIYSESGGNPAAVNPKGGATGLIQFMPSTAKRLGTTTEKIAKMSAEEQLPYVKKYLQNAKRSAGFSDNDKIDSGTLYALVFLPAYAKKGVLTSAGSKYYNANKGLDANHDGYITKDDLAYRVKSHYVA